MLQKNLQWKSCEKGRTYLLHKERKEFRLISLKLTGVFHAGPYRFSAFSGQVALLSATHAEGFSGTFHRVLHVSIVSIGIYRLNNLNLHWRWVSALGVTRSAFLCLVRYARCDYRRSESQLPTFIICHCFYMKVLFFCAHLFLDLQAHTSWGAIILFFEVNFRMFKMIQRDI